MKGSRGDVNHVFIFIWTSCKPLCVSPMCSLHFITSHGYCMRCDETHLGGFSFPSHVFFHAEVMAKKNAVR